MAISRMNIPRQHYGLGSLVKKAVKAVTKPVKQIIKSPIGKAALLGLGAYGLGGGTFFGRGFPGMGQGFSMSNILPNIKGLSTAGKAALGGAALAFGGGDPTKTEGFDMARRKGNVEEYLRKYYREYMQSDWETGWTQDEEDAFVARYTNEYNQGGRVGFYAGTDEDDLEEFHDDDLDIIELMKDQGVPIGEQVRGQGSGIKSLDAGAQPIVKTGNYETQDSKLVERYNEHKQEDGTMSFDEFEKFESMTAMGGPFSVLRKLGFKSNEISNLFKNLATMGKEYKTNENFKHLYRLLANPMENKEAIIDIMQQYGKKIPKVLKGKTKKTRKKRSIGGIMGGRVGLKAMQDLLDDDEEEFAQGGRIGFNSGSDIFGLGDPEKVSKVGKKITGGIENLASKVATDEEGNLFLPNQLLRRLGEILFFGGQKNPELPESFYNKLGDKYIEEMKKTKKAQGGRIGLFTGGSIIKNLGLDEDYVREIRIQWLEAGKPGRFSEFLRNELDYQAELSDEMKSQMANGGRVGYASGNEVIDVSTPEGDAYLREHNPGLTYESRETPPWLTIDDFENLEDYMRYLRMMNQNNQGGRVGLYTGGDPDDYPEQEDDVTPWQLQQEEGVPIGPMANLDKLRGLSEADVAAFMAQVRIYMAHGMSENDAIEEVAKEGWAKGGRVGAFGGGVMGIGVPGMRLPGIPRMAPDGIEFDMRAGGFQNLGAQEGKDDVNAKLAKNEFVMTADAVRGAGGGSIEKGAQRMYDTMKKLESKVG